MSINNQSGQLVGKWLTTDEPLFTNRKGHSVYQVICSNCNGLAYLRRLADGRFLNANLCPNCGAEMQCGLQFPKYIIYKLSQPDPDKDVVFTNIEVDELLGEAHTRGTWIYQFRDSENEEYRCSVCGNPTTVEFPFCHWCGADMQDSNKV